MSLHQSDEEHDYSSGGGGMGLLEQPFEAYFSQHNSSPDGMSLKRRMIAYGNAFHTRAAKVVCTTNCGHQVSSKVVNGFWCVQIVNPEYLDSWESIVAVDGNGRSIHTFELPKGP